MAGAALGDGQSPSFAAMNGLNSQVAAYSHIYFGRQILKLILVTIQTTSTHCLLLLLKKQSSFS